ncbi:Holliday junction resolvase RuvX [Candidatus Parcubacteria bacterium]|nr:Holliday junction resolvase RuvX [Candidatus Parcubacteria bacterium]MCK5490423.1 Holliday junction resolvase RuvX [Candidatus Paceibacterota bacterium]
MKILAIDYGDRKIGLAISDENQKLASRLLTLENKTLEKSVFSIKDIITKENIGEILIGIPVGLKMESEQARKTEKFITFLKEEITIPFQTINEVFTSRIAEENLLLAGVKRENFREVIDQEAARIILQEYLDKID